MIRRLSSPLPFLAVAIACAAPTPAYLGEWTPDMSQADLSKVTLVYEQLDSNRYRATMDGQSFEFTDDGSEAQTPWGGTSAIQALDSLHWESVFRVGGQVMGTDTISLSPDGGTLVIRSHRSATDGTTGATEMTLRRSAGESGLAGTWEGAEVSGQLTGDLTIADSGAAGLAFTWAAMEATCTAQLGGADSPIASPMFEDGWSCAAAERAPDAIALTWKRNGEVRYTAVLSPSADGATLTEVTTAEGTDEPVTMVYLRKGADQ
jgi:hypothetical protein